ncbi:putative HNHc nuclease [Macrococcus bovicus]|uniref:DUF968 domain-containing protein n=1 Tax=Macrococcus bovicus TaxID=69968 RepID=A0A4R6BWA2_9STAP|nr:putative HNHc nuclease [Macrococcus bovicus]TDM12686.1 hypothetical protein ERX55_10550 [Macrococcus bovicus]
MARIERYHHRGNGRFDIVVRNVSLDDDTLQLLDNEIPVAANLEVIDPHKITVKQRKKIFALLNDIYEYTGQPQDDLRQTFQFYLETIKGYKPISLSDTTKQIARELIELILEWVFLHDIPLNYKTSDLMKEDKRFIYLATIKRKCVICGKPHSDLAHRHAIGRGMNRNEMNHYGNEVLALCRQHHGEQHQIGIDSFNEKYHLHDSWIQVDDKLNAMLRGEKSE